MKNTADILRSTKAKPLVVKGNTIRPIDGQAESLPTPIIAIEKPNIKVVRRGIAS
jgi:hypothetical protein